MTLAPPQHQRGGAKAAVRKPGPAPQRKAAMGRPYGLNHVQIGPVDNGLEAQASTAASRVLRGEQGVAHTLTPTAPAAVAVPSRGAPLLAAHRAWLEPSFGADLSEVRVHHGKEAAAAARAEHAHAFTAGRDIYFGDGQFDPHVHEGRHLLAHEVAHVLQQTAVGTPGRGTRASAAAGTGEVQRVPAPARDMPVAVHDATTQVTRPGPSRSTAAHETANDKKRPGRLP